VKTARWAAGQQILVRYVSGGRVRYAEPVTVVSDDAGRLIVYQCVGTPCKWTFVDFDSGTSDGPRDHIWHSTNVLKIYGAGDAHAVWAVWAEEGAFKRWYVDMQAPIRRTADGVVTDDHALDIVVEPDLSWRWKDEDHLDRLVELDRISADHAAAVRREGETVVRRIEGLQPPFIEAWPDWRPDPAWPIPRLPDDWSRIPA
jgi:hypothetical protein